MKTLSLTVEAVDDVTVTVLFATVPVGTCVHTTWKVRTREAAVCGAGTMKERVSVAVPLSVTLGSADGRGDNSVHFQVRSEGVTFGAVWLAKMLT